MLIETIHELLAEKTRAAAIIDSQSVKTTLVSIQNSGFDADKKIKGIKRHIITNTMGLILAVSIHSKGEQDRMAPGWVVAQLVEDWHKVVKLFADGGYQGKLEKHLKKVHGIKMDIMKRTAAKVFEVLPKRWIMERTFSWIDTNRRNPKYYTMSG